MHDMHDSTFVHAYKVADATLYAQVRMLRVPSWQDALVGKATDFPELATALGARSAAIASGIRYKGPTSFLAGVVAVSTASSGPSCMYRILLYSGVTALCLSLSLYISPCLSLSLSLYIYIYIFL